MTAKGKAWNEKFLAQLSQHWWSYQLKPVIVVIAVKTINVVNRAWRYHWYRCDEISMTFFYNASLFWAESHVYAWIPSGRGWVGGRAVWFGSRCTMSPNGKECNCSYHFSNALQKKTIGSEYCVGGHDRCASIWNRGWKARYNWDSPMH